MDVSLLTDISNLKSGALIVIAGLELIKILETIDNSQIEKSKQIIKKAAHGYSETKIVTSPLSSISALTGGSVTTFHKGLLSSEKQENRGLILKAFVELKKAGKAFINKEIIFLFDSLDRLSNSEIFVDSVLDDVVEINNSEVGSVLVGSIATMYEERDSITEIVGHSHFLPYLDISENIAARKVFTDIFAVRDPEKIISLEARNLLMYSSGGVLRDLMSLCQASIEEAYVDGSDQITEQHTNQAILAVRRSKLIGLTDSNVDTLRKVMSEKSFSPRTSEDFDLLLTGHILEYRYPRQRFVVHPILAPLIENMAVSVANG